MVKLEALLEVSPCNILSIQKTWDVMVLELVEIEVRQLQLQLLPFVVPAHPSRTEVIKPEPLTLEFELILEMEELLFLLSYGTKDRVINYEGVRSEECRSCVFKNYDKSSSFIFFDISSALDSSFVPESFFVPSSISCYEDIESLGADNPGSASAVESTKASCPDAVSECK
ncbi:hypothetical protein Tco_0777735 [Tanacetum coccineum]